MRPCAGGCAEAELAARVAVGRGAQPCGRQLPRRLEHDGEHFIHSPLSHHLGREFHQQCALCGGRGQLLFGPLAPGDVEPIEIDLAGAAAGSQCKGVGASRGAQQIELAFRRSPKPVEPFPGTARAGPGRPASPSFPAARPRPGWRTRRPRRRRPEASDGGSLGELGQAVDLLLGPFALVVSRIVVIRLPSASVRPRTSTTQRVPSSLNISCSRCASRPWRMFAITVSRDSGTTRSTTDRPSRSCAAHPRIAPSCWLQSRMIPSRLMATPSKVPSAKMRNRSSLCRSASSARWRRGDLGPQGLVGRHQFVRALLLGDVDDRRKAKCVCLRLATPGGNPSTSTQTACPSLESVTSQVCMVSAVIARLQKSANRQRPSVVTNCPNRFPSRACRSRPSSEAPARLTS